jgi:hypothetical protein
MSFMVGQDWWDEEAEPAEYTANGQKWVDVLRDAHLFQWLLNQLSGKDLWMDGTMHWSLPVSVFAGIRARTSLEAVQMAYDRYKSIYGKELSRGGADEARDQTIPEAVQDQAQAEVPGSGGDAAGSVQGIKASSEVRSS